jgi:hypothetical protein
VIFVEEESTSPESKKSTGVIALTFTFPIVLVPAGKAEAISTSPILFVPAGKELSIVTGKRKC